MLATLSHGDVAPGAVPLLIAHGLFGSGRNWGAIAKRLSETRPVITVDMRNHGTSPWSDTHRYPEMAEDLAEVIAEHGGQADLLGHSMGGKAAMVLACQSPARVRRLVVADIAPVAYEHSQGPLVEAMRALDLDGVGTRAEADRRLAASVPDRATRAFLLQSLDVSGGGWRLNLEVLGRDMDHIMGFVPLEPAFDGPVLFLSGGASDYVTAANRPEIRRLFPRARFVRIPDAGHWLHADKPGPFAAAVETFLDAN